MTTRNNDTAWCNNTGLVWILKSALQGTHISTSVTTQGIGKAGWHHRYGATVESSNLPQWAQHSKKCRGPEISREGLQLQGLFQMMPLQSFTYLYSNPAVDTWRALRRICSLNVKAINSPVLRYTKPIFQYLYDSSTMFNIQLTFNESFNPLYSKLATPQPGGWLVSIVACRSVTNAVILGTTGP